jgi:hypothetical protein
LSSWPAHTPWLPFRQSSLQGDVLRVAPIRRRQTLFSVLLNASRGLRLQAITADAAQANLQDPLAYGPSQQLGAWMRDHRHITRLSSVTTTASCIVLGASYF